MKQAQRALTTMLLDKTLSLACRVHAGQTDKAGKPYILHPLRLMMRFEEEEAMLVALLHDVVEDTPTTLADLRALGLPDTVVSAIDCLTRRDDESYDAFIDRILQNDLARRVKIEDIKDNLDITRLAELSDNDLQRVKKYHCALKKLLCR